MRSPPLSLFVALFVLLCAAGIFVVLRRRPPSPSEIPPVVSSRHEELLRLLKEQPSNTRYYVSLKNQSAGIWHTLKTSQASTLILQDGQRVTLEQVRAFVVAYPSGEVLATSMPPPKKLPAGTFFARPTSEGAGNKLSDADIEAVSSDVKVEFGEVRRSKSRGDIYETKVVNKGKVPIRVTHFGAYSRQGHEWILNTIVEGFFTTQRFQEWYGVSGDGWLEPGAFGVDRENYGPNSLWVYFYETRDGQQGKAIGKAPGAKG